MWSSMSMVVSAITILLLVDIVGAHPSEEVALIAMHIDQSLKAVLFSAVEEPVDRALLIGLAVVGIKVIQKIATDHFAGRPLTSKRIGDELEVFFQRFLAVDGVDGLIHITDLSWGRVSDPHEVVELDQKINVVILDFDEEKKRIALGLKQLTPHPWDALDPNLKVGDHVKGKVVVMADYGAFVEIQPGVEGLIHVSEMSWSQHLRSAQDFLKVGDEVEAVILTLDREERKMSLGIKQLKEDPWETIEVKYPVGSKHTAKVRNFTNFGIFVELEEGVDGLIHISDLSWTKKVKHPSEFTSVGSDIDVVVLEIDKENRRLSLGHKQLEENPWDAYETLYTPGSVHTGKITEMMDKGAVISLNEGGEGFATPKHLVKEDGTQAQLGEELPFVVIEFVKDSHRIILSHSRTFEEVKEEPRKPRHNARKEQAPQINNVAAGTSLGDLGVLADLKAKMEGDKK